MSRLFWDHLIVLEEFEVVIKSLEISNEEKEELWRIVDEILHHKVLGCVLDHLPQDHHHEFLTQFHRAPHDESLLDYINEKTKKDVSPLIQKRVKKVALKLLQEIQETS